MQKIQDEGKVDPAQEAEFEKELKEYRALKTEKWNTSGIPEDLSAPAYIISKKWHKQWKRYLGARKTYFALYQWDREDTKDTKRVHPGPIDNTDILDNTQDFYKSSNPEDIYNVLLKPEMRERIDFKIINDKQWDFLVRRYGGTPIKREKFKQEHFSFVQVEVYFQRINLIVLPSRDDFVPEKVAKEKPIYASKRWPLEKVRERIVNVLNEPKYGFQLKPGKFRLWKLDPMMTLTQLLQKVKLVDEVGVDKKEDPDVEENIGIEFPGICLDMFGSDKHIEKLDIGEMDKVVLEVPNDQGEYIFRYRRNVRIGKCDFCYQERPMLISCKCNEAHYCSETCLKKDEHFHAEKCTAIDMNEDLSKYKHTSESNMGLTGLQNLGNTCFMNSGLQCLSNTWQLTMYFLKDLYLPEINTENKLGLQGRMAKSFAKLVKLLWYNDAPFISPWDLKRVVGKYHSAFSGFAQQDSQELISTVLDALHEDLNRVKDKPYVEQQTASNPDDNSASEPNWYNYLARNRSIVVDLFHGQYKSVVQCPKCSKYSITFDPFSVISLPVPQDKSLVVLFYYMPYDLSKKIKRHSIVMSKTDTVDTLRDKVSTMLGVPKYGSIFTMVSGGTFDRFLSRNLQVKVIGKMQKNQHSFLYIQEINPKYFNSTENIGLEKRKKMDEEGKAKAVAPMEVEEQKEAFKEKVEEETKSIITVPRPVSFQNGIIGSKMKSTAPTLEGEDYNNGLSENMLRVTLHIYKITKHIYWAGTTKERKALNRVIFVKKSDTLKELHFEIFRYFRPLFERKLSEASSLTNSTFNSNADVMTNPFSIFTKGKIENPAEMSDEELFESLFPHLNEENWQEKLKTTKDYPYELNMVNVAERNYFHKEKCFYCGNEACDNCPVPFTKSMRVIDMVSRLGKEPIRNDYYYYEHRYYSESKKEFELEVVFNEDPEKCIIDVSRLDSVETDKKPSQSTTARTTPGTSIYDCLDAFNKWEVLDNNNLWYCSSCQDSVPAKKKMEIIRAPPILVLHLKRFKARANGIMSATGGRLNTLVDFPLEGLNLEKYIKGSGPEPIYDLYAVSNHYGSTGFGHYTAFAWNKHNKGWYRFDDSHVTKMEPREVCTSAAYVLFYQRRDMKEEMDYEKIKQKVPEWYKVPIIVTKPPEIKASNKVDEEDVFKAPTIRANGTDNKLTGVIEMELEERSNMYKRETGRNGSDIWPQCYSMRCCVYLMFMID
eukprot:TRINITY_DN460_c0_g1_i1.p1 TRINITY_DN460_c0_g1~~TRINITY_DN460_c0_g1_i1.p1  ORF type:complete len:1219 (+),score=142.94 TRINITY_DN460_c0_g1_i1:187-3843(+)